MANPDENISGGHVIWCSWPLSSSANPSVPTEVEWRPAFVVQNVDRVGYILCGITTTQPDPHVRSKQYQAFKVPLGAADWIDGVVGLQRDSWVVPWNLYTYSQDDPNEYECVGRLSTEFWMQIIAEVGCCVENVAARREIHSFDLPAGQPMTCYEWRNDQKTTNIDTRYTPFPYFPSQGVECLAQLGTARGGQRPVVCRVTRRSDQSLYFEGDCYTTLLSTRNWTSRVFRFDTDDQGRQILLQIS